MHNGRVLGGLAGVIAITVLVVGFVIVRPVLAQEESTTTDQVVDSVPVDTISSSTPSDTPVDATDASATPVVEDASTSAVITEPPAPPPPPMPPPPPATTGDESLNVLGASTSAETAESTPASDTLSSSSDTTTETAVPSADQSGSTEITAPSSTPEVSEEVSVQREAPPADITEVHIIGIKYIDYFTEGTTAITSYPGDPDIDSHLSEPNAPIPTHEELTWVHTTGQNLYDTPSGDLEPGDYAYRVDGSIVSNPVVSNEVFVSSTSPPSTIKYY